MGQSGQPDLSGATAVRIEFLVVDLMNRLLAARPDQVDQAIDAALAEIGRACSLDRTFVFRFDETTGYSNTHEWVAPGIMALRREMQATSADLCPAWHAELLAGRVVEVADRNLLPGNSPERALLERIGVHASLKVPMRDGERLFGVIGYDCNAADGHWSRDEVHLLVSISRAMASVLLRSEATLAEADLRRKLEATLSALPELVVEISAKGVIEACRSTKLPWLSSLVRAGVGRPLRDILPPALAEVVEAAMANPSKVRRVQSRLVDAPGSPPPHSYEIALAPMSATGAGQTSGFVVVIRDLTAAERSSQVASYREGQFNGFFEMCPHPILLNDFTSGEILDGNPAFKAAFGIDPHERSGLHVGALLPSGGAQLIKAAVEKLQDTQSFGPVATDFRRKDGSAFPVTLRCFLITDPDGRRLVWSLIEDMTEVQAKEAALKAEQGLLEAVRSRFVAAIEALDDGFAVFDAEDRLVIWNRPYTRVFAAIGDLIREGALYDDLLVAAIERGIFEVRDAEGRDNLQRRLHRPLDEVWDNEDEFADGRLIWVRERSTPERETVGLYEDVTARRLADRRLQEIIDGGEVAVWDWDDVQGFTRINARWGGGLGVEEGQDFETLLDHVHPSDRFQLLTMQRSLFTEGAEDFSLRYRRRNAEGRWVWLLSRGRVASRHSDGRPRRIWGLTLDISAQTDAEQRLKQVIEGARVGTWEYDHSQQSTVLNDVWAEILGYRKEELSPLRLERWLDLVHPEDRATLIKRHSTLHPNGTSAFEDELRLRHRDGHWVWILSRGQVSDWDENGRPLRESGIHLDISAAKALETALERERDTLARLMETSVSGIIAVDGDGGAVFSNAAAARILGREIGAGESLVTLLGQAKISSLEGQPIAATDLPIVRALQRQAGLHEMRHVIEWPSGARKVVAVAAAPLSAPGTELAAVCSLTDITVAVENEERLRAAMTAAEAANRAKSDFLAAMSHEIRTPLNGVLGMATVLGNRLADADELAMLRIIRDSGEHLLGVINDILDLAKIEAGRLVLDPKPTRMCDLVERVAALHRQVATDKGLVLTTRCNGAGAEDMRLADEQRVIQILHNLIGNALKFTDQGAVRVDVALAAADRVGITVTDTGIGMTEAEIERAFEDFTQVPTGARRQQSGTGLGLPIVRRLARLMDGEISLTSSPQGGVTARVELALPRLQRDAAFPAAADRLLVPPLRVLAAEDNATNRIILQGMLRTLGLEAEIVGDGATAVARFDQDRFDVVLLDITMPGMDGLETLDALAELARRSGRMPPRAVAVTANAMTHQVGEYLARGFAAVVAKPIRIEVLARALVPGVGEAGAILAGQSVDGATR